MLQAGDKKQPLAFADKLFHNRYNIDNSQPLRNLWAAEAYI